MMTMTRTIGAMCGVAGLMALGACEGNGNGGGSMSAASGGGMTMPAVDTVSGPSRATVGGKAPNFTLRDLDGDMHSLAEYTNDGDIVVLEWFNPGCPFVQKHYQDAQNQTMNELADEYEGQDVVWLRINSGAPGMQGHGVERNKQVKRNWDIDGPILVDETGVVGRAYGATTTPHMFVIDASGTLVYEGAIDSDSSATGFGETNYVEQALEDLMAGRDVRTPSTKQYGCSVKYAGG